jgi:hypothetical protein
MIGLYIVCFQNLRGIGDISRKTRVISTECQYAVSLSRRRRSSCLPLKGPSPRPWHYQRHLHHPRCLLRVGMAWGPTPWQARRRLRHIRRLHHMSLTWWVGRATPSLSARAPHHSPLLRHQMLMQLIRILNILLLARSHRTRCQCVNHHRPFPPCQTSRTHDGLSRNRAVVAASARVQIFNRSLRESSLGHCVSVTLIHHDHGSQNYPSTHGEACNCVKTGVSGRHATMSRRVNHLWKGFLVKSPSTNSRSRSLDVFGISSMHALRVFSVGGCSTELVAVLRCSVTCCHSVTLSRHRVFLK